MSDLYDSMNHLSDSSKSDPLFRPLSGVAHCRVGLRCGSPLRRRCQLEIGAFAQGSRSLCAFATQPTLRDLKNGG